MSSKVGVTKEASVFDAGREQCSVAGRPRGPRRDDAEEKRDRDQRDIQPQPGAPGGADACPRRATADWRRCRTSAGGDPGSWNACQICAPGVYSAQRPGDFAVGGFGGEHVAAARRNPASTTESPTRTCQGNSPRT